MNGDDSTSSDGDAPEDAIDTESVGGLGELVPEPLLPAWRRVEAVQAFRATYGDTYVGLLEALTAVVLTGGYLYWAFLFLTQ
ncbi:hypothetical protein ACFQPA_17420 [Halomarina halobia]|uniref:Uncharacterized protein n=1 Tax=Halomarina halobia TaxID=3033386 RepID=A0ABD6ADT6_9EURY|nr:hypothetical protein [Halomarina sp. PSR21]